MIKAIALVGFYRGDLVEPGQILDLPENEFGELKSFLKVDYAPEQPPEQAKAQVEQKSKK